jgi:hypothetical protein
LLLTVIFARHVRWPGGSSAGSPARSAANHRTNRSARYGGSADRATRAAESSSRSRGLPPLGSAGGMLLHRRRVLAEVVLDAVERPEQPA